MKTSGAFLYLYATHLLLFIELLIICIVAQFRPTFALGL
ncbi:hypothetical protein GMES_2215 [Paraglaciecola mesophila KMM 241]|uniref:Uncharacterized protein n=1 Tax=Paraglaciecola mesophila KMM 241 TaxID=1128912 RepID=K6YKH9_9ALTE|nr:hypothetical protein GMES_2215 [Paraglaciecola mesophila KMM 241]